MDSATMIQARADMLDYDHDGTCFTQAVLGRIDVNHGMKRWIKLFARQKTTFAIIPRQKTLQ